MGVFINSSSYSFDDKNISISKSIHLRRMTMIFLNLCRTRIKISMIVLSYFVCVWNKTTTTTTKKHEILKSMRIKPSHRKFQSIETKRSGVNYRLYTLKPKPINCFKNKTNKFLSCCFFFNRSRKFGTLF